MAFHVCRVNHNILSHVSYLILRRALDVYHQKESNSMGYENKQIFVNSRICYLIKAQQDYF